MSKQRTLPYIILGVLSTCQSRLSGKQITDYVCCEIGEFWQVAHSQVYPELKRMVQEGLLDLHAVEGNDKERHYSMTSQGQAFLEDWLSIPNEETPQQKDIFSLKMFFIRSMDDDRIVGHLEGQIVLLEKHLQHLLNRKETLFDEAYIANNYGHYLVLERAIARNTGQLKWLRETLAQQQKKKDFGQIE